VFECVINISEGRSTDVLARLDAAAGASLRDRHSDAAHHRSVFTLINEPEPLLADVRALARATVATLDFAGHHGVHPRLGLLDVVPFVPLAPATLADAVVLRDEFAAWVADELGTSVFLYGPIGHGERSLPFVRRHAFVDLAPDLGPATPVPAIGAVTVGARPLLLAWNIWLADTSLERTKEIAARLRRPGVRTLGLSLGELTQVSCNLHDLDQARPDEVFDEALHQLHPGEHVHHVELVGLAPQNVLDPIDRSRWGQLGLDASTTIESRLTR